MPLVGGRDLQSPAGALRVMAQQFEAERASGAERATTIGRLQSELARASSQIAQMAAEREASARTFAAERDTWLQQKVALHADSRALEGELSKTRSQLSATIDLRARRDSQIAQLRAEIEDAARQFELHKTKMIALETERQEWESARLRLEIENRDLQLRLEAGLRQYQSLREKVALLEDRAEGAERHSIEMAHYLGPLLDEMDQLRRDYRKVAPGSRLRALWNGLTEKCIPLLRSVRVHR